MSIIIDSMRNSIREHNLISKGDNVVVGFSGGPDSSCLLHSLYLLKEELGIKQIAAVHINHMYRGEDAFKDEKFSENFCESRGILFFAYRYDVENMAKEMKMSSEEVGRKVRYEAFAEIAEKLGGAKIAVAHNRQDQAETLLMRMVRGTGTEGLCGIEYCREGGIIRPLLNCSRKDIEEFCDKENLNPQIDLTNLQPIYTRNVVRLNLIPYINEVMGCDIVDSLAVLSDIAKEDKDFISGFVKATMEKFVSETEIRGYIFRNLLKELHPAVRKRVIVKCFESVGLRQDIGAVHINSAEQILTSENTTGQVDFPNKYVMKCRYDKVYFEKVHENNTIEYKLNCRIVNDESLLSKYLSRKPDRKDKDFQCFDIGKIAQVGDLTVRFRKPGDVISPKGFKGTKKLKEYFIDRKIDRDIRDKIPLVCAGNRVLWVFGYEINQNFIPDENTTEILVVSIEPDDNI